MFDWLTKPYRVVIKTRSFRNDQVEVLIMKRWHFDTDYGLETNKINVNNSNFEEQLTTARENAWSKIQALNAANRKSRRNPLPKKRKV